MARLTAQWHPGEERTKHGPQGATGTAAGSSGLQDLDMSELVPPPQAAAQKADVRKASNKTLQLELHHGAVLAPHTSTQGLPSCNVPGITTHSDILALSLARVTPKSDKSSSVALTSTALQALSHCTASAQLCLHCSGPCQVATSPSLMCGQPGPGGGFADRPWNRRRSQGNGKGSGPAGTLHNASSGCRKEQRWP